MKIGVVGKANVGKSTFFKALTLADVLIANYPFATIKPNVGFGHVKLDCVDKDLNTQCNPREGFCVNHNRFVPVEVVDVAGLVPGAYEGKGMGNQFLDDLRQADALIHVIDCSGSTNELGEPKEAGSYDPADDIKFLETELDMWYLGILQKSWEKFAKLVNQENPEIDKAIAKQFSGVGATDFIVREIMKKEALFDKRITLWDENDIKNVARDLRKATKPMIIAANKIDMPIAQANFERLKKEFPDSLIVPCSSESELALKEAAKHGLIKYIPGENDFEAIGQLSENQKMALEFIRKNVLQKFGSTGVQEVINEAVFRLLKYIAIFPGGVNKLTDQYGRVLPDCFLMPHSTTALDFAFKLHTDFGKNFIRAIDVRKKLPVGKDHALQHRDIIEIISGK
jgi:ribosome-binding ATPase YchF (GTP1/OBG family)